MPIDLNADAGEAFGRWQVADEAALFPQLTSVNLACGFHAGDPQTLLASVRLAKRFKVAVGAHPGFPDRVGFGRRDLSVTEGEVYADTLYQLGALNAFLRLESLPMHHVKAHGALYLKMARDVVTARGVAAAVAAFNPALPLVTLGGPGGEIMQRAAEAAGLRTVAEAFPDRAYLADGSLAPRSLTGAVLDDPEHVAERAVAMALGKPLQALDGGTVTVEADTLCLHGDNEHAPANAAAVRRALAAAGVEVRAF